MDVRFEGLEELTQHLETMGREADKYAEEALVKAGTTLQTETKKHAPVRTGNLSRHIELSKVKDGEIDVYVDQQGPAYYGRMLEEGTSKMNARPFMYPAFHKSRFKLEREMAKVLRERLGMTL